MEPRDYLTTYSFGVWETIYPEEAERLRTRAGLTKEQAEPLCVLEVQSRVNADHPSGQERHVTMVMLVDRPVLARLYGVGAAVRSPEDLPDSARGRRIALARALRGYGARVAAIA